MSPVLPPSTEVRVRGKVHASVPLVGASRRRPFGVRVQGRTTPVLLEGAFVQRAVFGAWLLKAVAVLAVIARWVSVAVVGISALSGR